MAKRFRSGRPSLDFAHTSATEEWTEPELIPDAISLQRWLGHILGRSLRVGEDEVAPAHRLRAAVLRLARARALEQQLPAADVRTLNGFAAAPPPVPELRTDGTAGWGDQLSVPEALSVLARDAIDLLTGTLGHRIRICAAADCGYLFVDASRPGTRRWCSMQRCGNLAKVRAHRDARAAGPRSSP